MNHWKNLSLVDLPGEVWKTIKGYNSKYKVSSYGRVKLIAYYTNEINPKPIKERILPQTLHFGYPTVNLNLNRKNYHKNAHRLVAETFIEPVEGKKEVNHIDGIKTNSCVSNLEWCNRKENIQHAILTGLTKVKGEDNGMAKLNNQRVLEIYNCPLKQKEIVSRFKVPRNVVSCIKLGRTWSHITGKTYEQKRFVKSA